MSRVTEYVVIEGAEVVKQYLLYGMQPYGSPMLKSNGNKNIIIQPMIRGENLDSEREVTNYVVCAGEEEINKHISYGFQPYRDPMLKHDGGAIYLTIQVMVKYKETEKVEEIKEVEAETKTKTKTKITA